MPIQNWPTAYIKDPTFSLLRPLLDDSWLSSFDTLDTYLTAQSRRFKTRARVKEAFLDLQKLIKTADFPFLTSFFLDPWSSETPLDKVHIELRSFLECQFRAHPFDPWEGLDTDKEEKTKLSISEEELLNKADVPQALKKKLIEKKLKEMNWQEHLKFISGKMAGDTQWEDEILQQALSEEEHLREYTDEKKKEILTNYFAPPIKTLELTLPLGTLFKVQTLPVIIGQHYVTSKVQQIWLNNKGYNFQKLLGTYARWDNAPVLLTRNYRKVVNLKRVEDELRAEHGLKMHGPWLNALNTLDNRIDGAFVLLLDKDFPAQDFILNEWRINVGSYKTAIEPYKLPEKKES